MPTVTRVGKVPQGSGVVGLGVTVVGIGVGVKVGVSDETRLGVMGFGLLLLLFSVGFGDKYSGLVKLKGPAMQRIAPFASYVTTRHRYVPADGIDSAR